MTISQTTPTGSFKKDNHSELNEFVDEVLTKAAKAHLTKSQANPPESLITEIVNRIKSVARMQEGRGQVMDSISSSVMDSFKPQLKMYSEIKDLKSAGKSDKEILDKIRLLYK